MHFDEGFKADLVGEHSVIIEVKSVKELAPLHGQQVLTYLRLMDYRVGLLINFNSLHLRDGIKRIAN